MESIRYNKGPYLGRVPGGVGWEGVKVTIGVWTLGIWPKDCHTLLGAGREHFVHTWEPFAQCVVHTPVQFHCDFSQCK